MNEIFYNLKNYKCINLISIKIFLKVLKKIFKYLNRFNLFSSSKTLHSLMPSYLIELRMNIINVLHKNSPYRFKLRKDNPELNEYFDKLDSHGVLIIRNFLPKKKI